MNDLIEVLEKLKEKLAKYSGQLSGNEFLVRYVLIDPLLRALGWDTESPDHVRPEENIGVGRPDYALVYSGVVRIFLGAKALGKAEDLDKMITYCNARGVQYFAATDGAHWELYEVFKPVPTAQKKVVEFDLRDDDLVEVARRALSLWRSPSLGQSAAAPILKATPLAVGQAAARQVATTTNLVPTSIVPGYSRSGSSTLGSFVVHAGDRPPKKLIDPANGEHNIKKWKDILTVVVEWLTHNNLLTKQECPISLPRAHFRYVVAASPKHQRGDSFREPVQVNDIWVETHASAHDLVYLANFLVEKLGKGVDFTIPV